MVSRCCCSTASAPRAVTSPRASPDLADLPGTGSRRPERGHQRSRRSPMPSRPTETPVKATESEALAMRGGFADSTGFRSMLWWAVLQDVPTNLHRVDCPVSPRAPSTASGRDRPPAPGVDPGSPLPAAAWSGACAAVGLRERHHRSRPRDGAARRRARTVVFTGLNLSRCRPARVRERFVPGQRTSGATAVTLASRPLESPGGPDLECHPPATSTREHGSHGSGPNSSPVA
jgi:hypothetical protein